MTETNEETFAPGQDINVQQEPNITDHLLNVSVPNADLPHTPEIQAQYMVRPISIGMINSNFECDDLRRRSSRVRPARSPNSSGQGWSTRTMVHVS